MKKIVISFLALGMLAGCGANSPLNIEQYVNEVTSELNSLIKTESTVENSTEGGKKTVYKNAAGEIKKVEEVDFGEGGKSEYQAYYKDKELLYAENKVSIYEKPIYVELPTDKTTHITMNQYFFEKGKLKKWLKNAEPVSSSDPEWARYETYLLELSQ